MLFVVRGEPYHMNLIFCLIVHRTFFILLHLCYASSLLGYIAYEERYSIVMQV